MLLTTTACLFGPVALSFILAALFPGRSPRSSGAGESVGESTPGRPIPEPASGMPFDRRLPGQWAPDWRDRPGPLAPTARRSPEPRRIRQV